MNKCQSSIEIELKEVTFKNIFMNFCSKFIGFFKSKILASMFSKISDSYPSLDKWPSHLNKYLPVISLVCAEAVVTSDDTVELKTVREYKYIYM